MESNSQNRSHPNSSQTLFFSSASCAVPVAVAAETLHLCRSPSLHVLEKVQHHVNTTYFGLTFGVQCARTLYCEQRYASIGVAQCHARTPRWLERRIVNPLLGSRCLCALAGFASLSTIYLQFTCIILAMDIHTMRTNVNGL